MTILVTEKTFASKFIEILFEMSFYSDPLVGEKLYTQMGFFVQTILADRYINPTKLRLVSLKISSSVEYEIKKIF